MDAAHFHLLITHFPIIGSVFGIVILAYGLFSKNDSIVKVGLVTFIAISLITIPVFLSGEEAEEIVEHIPGISEDVIEEHEELAEKAIWFMGILGVFSLINLLALIKNLSFVKTATRVTLITSLFTAGLFFYVGNLGGQIRHSEIRSNSESPSEQYEEMEEEDDDHDD